MILIIPSLVLEPRDGEGRVGVEFVGLCRDRDRFASGYEEIFVLYLQDGRLVCAYDESLHQLRPVVRRYRRRRRVDGGGGPGGVYMLKIHGSAEDSVLVDENLQECCA